MAEELIISAGSKEEKYRELVPQVKAVVETETDLIANMANVATKKPADLRNEAMSSLTMRAQLESSP